MHALAQGIVQGLVYGGIYAVVAQGFSMIYFTTGVFHVAYGAVFTLGVYLVLACGGADSVSGLVLGLVVGMAGAGLVNLLIHQLIYRPMLARGAKTLELFVVSLGLSLVIVAVVQIVWGVEPKSFEFPAFFRQHEVLGLKISLLGVTCIALGLIVLGVVELVGRRTLFGQQMRAIGANPELASLRGVRVGWATAGVYAMAGSISVVGAVLFGMTTTVTSGQGTDLTLLASLAALLGGRGSYLGTYVGALIVGLVGAVTAALLPGQWQIAVVFGAFIVLVLIRPTGLLRTEAAR